MTKITKEYTSDYDKGDVVIFKTIDQKLNNILMIGIIEGYNIDEDTFWFNIRISPTKVLSFSDGGDIPEYDIITKLEGEVKEECKGVILNVDD